RRTHRCVPRRGPGTGPPWPASLTRDLPEAGEVRGPGRTAASAAAAFSRPRGVQPAAARGRWHLAAGWSVHSGVPEARRPLRATVVSLRSARSIPIQASRRTPFNTALTRLMPCLSGPTEDWLNDAVKGFL